MYKEAYVNDFPRNIIGGAMAANMQKPMWSCAQPEIYKVNKSGSQQKQYFNTKNAEAAI